MIKDNFLVSIIVPCYNQAQYLDECLQSVLKQTYRYWECIIINDGSTDKSDEIAKKWVFKDSRFRYIYKENNGLSSARNTGLDLAKGDYIQFLDSDDLLEINRFELLLSLAKEKRSSENQILISTFMTLTSNLEVIDHPEFLKLEYFNLKNILYGWDKEFTIPIHCGLFSSFYFLDFRFDEDLKAKEDWIMWLAMFSTNPEVLFVNKGLVLYRENQKGLTRNLDLMKKNLDLAIKKMQYLIPIEEYCNFLQTIIYSKNEEIKGLEEKINKQQNSLSNKILKKIEQNKFAKFLLTCTLKIIKK